MINSEQNSELQILPIFPFPAQSSPDLVEYTQVLATRFQRAFGFLNQVLAIAPHVGLRVLSADDWGRHANPAFKLYGLTHYDPAQGMVITGGPDSTFWQPFIETIALAAPDLLGELQAVYGRAEGQIDLTRHIEWWIIHDLGHAFHLHLDYWFPRVWLMEFFADVCLYTYVASHEPAYLPALETLPRVLSQLKPTHFRYRTLPEFDTQYLNMELVNYLWYHGHFFEQARRAYGEIGNSLLDRFWHTFVLAQVQEIPDSELGLLLQQIEPEIAQMRLKWPG